MSMTEYVAAVAREVVSAARYASDDDDFSTRDLEKALAAFAEKIFADAYHTAWRQIESWPGK